MIRKEDFAVIKSLHQRGVYMEAITAELGVHKGSVAHFFDKQLSIQGELRIN